jgi:predicted outer membrane repeat protein
MEGGGIYNVGTLIVTNCTFSDNSAVNGGGIANVLTLTVINSTFSGNTATTDGGGIFNTTSGMLTVTNCTFSGNSASATGGAIFNGNVAPDTATISGTILVMLTSGNNCSGAIPGTITDGGNNLSDDASCGFAAPNPVTDTQLDLATAPANNGGPTYTIALGSNSIAIAAIPNSLCAYANVNPCTDPPSLSSSGALTCDQRGYVRPAVTNGACSIGAYEFGASSPTPTATPTPTPTPTPTATPTPIPGAVTITSPARGSTVEGLVTFMCINPGGSAFLYIDDNFIGYGSYTWGYHEGGQRQLLSAVQRL